MQKSQAVELPIKKSGFTLIELIVVLAVMGTVLFFTLPKFRPLTFGNESGREINILLNTVRSLKKLSLSDGKDYTLHLDSARSVVWITYDGMAPEVMEKAKEGGRALPESLRLTGVDIYGISNLKQGDEYKIRFSRQGYCDMALIHLKEQNSGDEFTVVIQPFLSNAEIEPKYISFEQCS